MNHAFIYDHVRTPRGRGRADGALHEISPISLTAQTLAALRDRSELDTALVEDVMMGCVMPIGEQGCNIARVAALQAGYAESVAGFQLNRFCASGLEAVNLAAARVMAGELDAAIGGGVECMSRVPIASDGGACYSDPHTHWQTWYIPQGIGADMIATLDGYSREDIDHFAMESQHRAGRASASGYFKWSLTPIRDILGEIVLSYDEAIRPTTTMQDLEKLKPAFASLGEQVGYDGVMLQRYPQTERIAHIHTGGNSSSIVDGAAAVLVGNREFGERAGLKPRARIRSFVSLGSEPAIMLTGPAAATRKALKKAGMTLDDIDLFEVNEAFASVVMRFMNELDVPHDKVNVNGGAIAMGHPLGATGAMILGTLLDELERRNLKTGLITLCAAAGMATATIIERV